MRKRILSIVLAIALLFTTTFSNSNALTAKASTVSISSQTNLELVMTLYNLFQTALVAAGIKDTIEEYEDGKTLFEAFMSNVQPYDWSDDGYDDVRFKLKDGTVITGQQYFDYIDSGGSYALPDEETWNQYRGADESVDTESLFTELASVAVGSGLFGLAGGFISDVWDGAVDGVVAETVFLGQENVAEYMYTGEYELNEDGTKYKYNGYTYFCASSATDIYHYVLDGAEVSVDKMVAGYLTTEDSGNYSAVKFLSGTAGSSSTLAVNLPFYVSRPSEGSVSATGRQSSLRYHYAKSDTKGFYSFDFPVFNTYAEAQAYFVSGEATGALNQKQPYSFNYKNLAAGVATTVAGLVGYAFAPNKTATVARGLGSLAADYVAESTDADEAAALYATAITAGLTDILPDAITDEDIETDVDTGTDSGTTGDTVKDYSSVLALILAAVESLVSSVVELPTMASNVADIVTWFPSIVEAADSLISVIPVTLAGIQELITDIPVTLANTYELISTLPVNVWDMFSGTLGGILSWYPVLEAKLDEIITTFPDLNALIIEKILTLPKAIWNNFSTVLQAILDGVIAIPGTFATWFDALMALLGVMSVNLAVVADKVLPSGTDEEGNKHSLDFLNILNGLILLILILIKLLSIFLHCLDFIMHIFEIPATTGYLPDEMILGLDYLKTLEITGLGMSVYDFMMGLVYILIVFGVVRILRKNVNFIRIPKK